MSYTDAEIAQVCHEANRALQTIHVTQGDRSIAVSPPWYSLDEETRTSAIQGAIGVASGHTPEKSHETWCDFKRAHGWKYGPVKNDVTKTHPCLVPYDQLPAEQRRKDHLFAAVVNALTVQLEEAADVDDEAARIRAVVAANDRAERHNTDGQILYGSDLGGPAKVGAIVHYVSHGTPIRKDGSQAYPAKCRAAVVTETGDGYAAGLCVLNPEGQFFNRNVPADPGKTVYSSPDLCRERTYEGGSWHWPAS